MTHLSKLLDLDPCDPPYILILELEKKERFYTAQSSFSTLCV